MKGGLGALQSVARVDGRYDFEYGDEDEDWRIEDLDYNESECVPLRYLAQGSAQIVR